MNDFNAPANETRHAAIGHGASLLALHSGESTDLLPDESAAAATQGGAERFFQLAPTIAGGGTAQVEAEIVGQVHFRQGDGVLLEVAPGGIVAELCSSDATLSWADDECRFSAAMPFANFHRYVVEGSIRVLACSLRGPNDARPCAAGETVWGELDALSRVRRDPMVQQPIREPAHSAAPPTTPSVDDDAPSEATDATVGCERSVCQLGMESGLLELVRLRASQINACAPCVDRHANAAAELGESPARLHSVVVWRRSSLFTPRERAALAWTESLSRLPDWHAPHGDYALLQEQFSDREIVDLTVAIFAVAGASRLRSERP